MRALRASGKELVFETIDVQSTPYAILSHRWLADEQEVRYQDVLSERVEQLSLKDGWHKLQWCREQAVADNIDYVWADTACIDKSSSQELTESINSMYRWYRKAKVCYVYLNDMPDPNPSVSEDGPEGEGESIPALQEFESQAEQIWGHQTTSAAFDSSQIELALLRGEEPRPASPLPATCALWTRWDRAAFASSSWWTRAWTLQEMIAPTIVRFYSQTWTFIGDLADLVEDVAEITGVHRKALLQPESVQLYSIAQRMSWAAHRKSTKVEDQAYSLLGILDIAMPVVYGEGIQAFQRLQEELLRTSSDDSIFAFNPSGAVVHMAEGKATALMASSPSDFKDCGDLIFIDDGHGDEHQMLTKQVNFRSRIIDRSALMLNTRLGYLLSSVPSVIPRFLTLILFIITLGGWRVIQKLFSVMISGRTRPKQEKYVVALLKCRWEHDLAVMPGLRLFPRKGDPNTLFVRGGDSRIETVDIHHEKQRICPYMDFSVVRRPEEASASAKMHLISVLCRSKTQSMKFVLTNASDPSALRTWDSDIHAFKIFADQDREDKYALPNFAAQLNLLLDGRAVAKVQINMHPSDWKFFRIKLDGWALQLPDWTNWILVRRSHYCSVRWHAHGFVIARGFANSRPLGRRDVLFLECEYLPLISLRLAYLATVRLMIGLACSVPFLAWQVFAAVLIIALTLPHGNWFAKNYLAVIGLLTPLELTFLSVHLGLVWDRRASTFIPMPWNTSHWWKAFRDWYLDRPSVSCDG